MAAHRVLILGGYGLFGERLATRLARWPQLELLIAGRSLARAQALRQALHAQASTAARLQAVSLDASAPDLAARLQALEVWALVNTAGPFQGQDHRVARACIDAGCHYLDLADSRAFVTGIERLDAQARARGVLVVSGASSVPALSGAAADALAAGMERVDRIDIGISPGGQAPAGAATVKAVLSYCGEPIASRNGPPDAVGWLGGWSHRFSAPVGPRLLAACDVPDLDLLGARHPGAPQVHFGAGLELRWMHRALQGMAALRQRGWVPNWSWAATPLRRMAHALGPLGSAHGGMLVRVQGAQQGMPCTRAWELIATHGDGPYVPTLAAAAVLRKLVEAEDTQRPMPAGAMPCLGLVNLEDFARETKGLRISWRQQGSTVSVFHQVMGPVFEQLHPALQRFHALQGRHRLRGHAQTLAPEGRLARWAARLLGTATQASEGPFEFELVADAQEEVWTRHFAGRTMRSTLSARGGIIEERLGITRLHLALETCGPDHSGLAMQLRGFRVLGVPVPRCLWPRVRAQERGERTETGWRLHFDIDSSLPLIGRVATYRGWIQLP